MKSDGGDFHSNLNTLVNFSYNKPQKSKELLNIPDLHEAITAELLCCAYTSYLVHISTVNILINLQLMSFVFLFCVHVTFIFALNTNLSQRKCFY